jgi:hypothetical protein
VGECSNDYWPLAESEIVQGSEDWPLKRPVRRVAAVSLRGWGLRVDWGWYNCFSRAWKLHRSRWVVLVEVGFL